MLSWDPPEISADFAAQAKSRDPDVREISRNQFDERRVVTFEDQGVSGSDASSALEDEARDTDKNPHLLLRPIETHRSYSVDHVDLRSNVTSMMA
ncbi:hypothetical protein ACWEK5_24070 [Rhodococcus koreensis]